MAFKVEVDPKTEGPTLVPAWISGNFDHPDPAVIANGVLFSLSNGENAVQRGGEATRLENTHPAVLRALDAATGKELYNSGSAISSSVHFSGLALANGKVYAVTMTQIFIVLDYLSRPCRRQAISGHSRISRHYIDPIRRQKVYDHLAIRSW